jgi:ABC-type transport system involved in multi-copper enzyme maturation permease subunit
MTSLWWAQIRAIIRLEMKKTFFAKRGLWVYLLALAPVALFLGHSIDMRRQLKDRQAMAAAHPVSRESLETIRERIFRPPEEGRVSKEELLKTLGQPYQQQEFRNRRRHYEIYRYTDGRANWVFWIREGEVTSLNIRDYCNFGEDSMIFAGVFQFFFLRLAIFFGCVGIFMNLFRGEMIDKSLHYYLLAPIKREVLLVGKYLAGLIATTVIFTASAAVQMLAMAWHFPSTVINQYLAGDGWSHIASYLGVTVLACLGYGSVFLAAGLFFRNPIIPAASVLLWEGVNIFLPAMLKKFSVIFYLQSLCPVVAPPDQNMPPPLKLLVSMAEPTAAPIAIAGLIAVTVTVLYLASRRVRRLEINYAAE